MDTDGDVTIRSSLSSGAVKEGEPMMRRPLCCVIPDYILRNIAERGNEEERRAAPDALGASVTMRSLQTQAEARRAAMPRAAPPNLTAALAPPTRERLIRDAKGSADPRGPVIRQEGGEPSGDTAIEEAFEHLRTTWDFYLEALARNSIDKAGMPLEGVVHYRQRYDNASGRHADDLRRRQRPAVHARDPVTDRLRARDESRRRPVQWSPPVTRPRRAR